MEISARVNIELAKATNYLILGNWSDQMSYKLSDAGVPVVRVPDGTSLGYSVYALNVAESTVGASPSGAGSSEWRLVESAEFIYMQAAYIERLQATLVTADIIQSLLIKTGNLEVLNGAKIGDMTVDNGAIISSYSYFTYIGSLYVQVTSSIKLNETGLVITSSYGGTVSHPQVVTWNSEFRPSLVKVGSMEMRRDGIYRDGTKIL